MSKKGRKTDEPLADFVFDIDADSVAMRPNAPMRVVAQSPVVLIRDEKWTEKKKRPKWSDDLIADLVFHLRDADQENFVVFLLDDTMHLIGIYEHSRGTSSQTSVDTGHVLKMAILTGASEIVICHNHPSGNATPSEADDLTTRSLARSLAVHGVRLQTHIVIGDEEDTLIVSPTPGDWGNYRTKVNTLKMLQWKAAASELTSRSSVRPYGKHDVWLVKSGFVRSEAIRELRSSIGIIQSTRCTSKALRKVWSGFDTSLGTGEGRVAILNLDSNLRVTSLVDIESTTPEDIGRQATVQGLLSGGKAAIVALYEESFDRDFARKVRTAMGGSVYGAVQLVEVVTFDSDLDAVSFSASEAGWLG